MKKYRSYFFVFSLCVNATLGSFFFGYLMGVFNPMQDNIEALNEWSKNEAKLYDGMVTSFMPFGAMIGAALSGIIAEKLGRRASFFIADGLGIIGVLLCIIKGLVPLLLGRLIGGIGVGINSAIVPLYINEMSPMAINGDMGSWVQLMINVGKVISFLMGLGLPKKNDFIADNFSNNWWRFTFALPIITCALRSLIIVIFFNYETPAYYVQKQKESEAEKVLKKIYKSEFVEDEFILVKILQNKGKNATFKQLFSKKFISRTLLGMMMSVIQQMSGANAVIFYSDKLFKGDAPNDFDIRMAKIFTVIVGVVLILASKTSGMIIDKSGRKKILILGEILCIITLLCLVILNILMDKDVFTTKVPSIIAILVYLFGFGVSLGPIVWLYLPEILPEKGVSLSALINWLFCFIIGLLFPLSLDQIGIAWTFFVFMICCIAGLIYMIVYVKETKGKTHEEVEKMFAGTLPILDTNTEEGLFSNN